MSAANYLVHIPLHAFAPGSLGEGGITKHPVILYMHRDFCTSHWELASAGGVAGDASALIKQERATLSNIYALLEALQQQQQSLLSTVDAKEVPYRPCFSIVMLSDRMTNSHCGRYTWHVLLHHSSLICLSIC